MAQLCRKGATRPALEPQDDKAIATTFYYSRQPGRLFTVADSQKLTDLWVDAFPRVLREGDHGPVIVKGVVVDPQIDLHITHLNC